MHNNRLNHVALHPLQRPLNLPGPKKPHKPLKRKHPLPPPPNHPRNLFPCPTIAQVVDLHPFRAAEEIHHVQLQDGVVGWVLDHGDADLDVFAAFAEGADAGGDDGEETRGVEGVGDFCGRVSACQGFDALGDIGCVGLGGDVVGGRVEDVCCS